MSGHMFLYGKKSVGERLKADPGSIRKVLLADNFNSAEIEKLIVESGITVQRLPAKKVQDQKRAKNVQGIVARVDAFVYSDLEKLLKDRKHTLIFLDRVNDPQNLGVIIRSLACFGGFAVVIPEKEACGVTDAVMHVSAGGENYVPVCRVSSLEPALTEAKAAGFSLCGAVAAEGTENINFLRMNFPLVLVLGSEISGISENIEKLLDVKVHIPMPGAKLSFNVSMAATVFAHEIVKQRSLTA